MDLPFIEISVVSTTDKEFTRKDICIQLFDLFTAVYRRNCVFVDQGDDSFIRIDFPSRSTFERVYEQSYLLYVHIFEEFIQENQAMVDLFSKSNQGSSPNGSEEGNQDALYLVLRYNSNYLAPLRQYDLFMTKVYKFFGVEIYSEEILGGFLRFIQTRQDYEILRLPGDLIDNWKALFQIRRIDPAHPAIQKFFSLLQAWKHQKEHE